MTSGAARVRRRRYFKLIMGKRKLFASPGTRPRWTNRCANSWQPSCTIFIRVPHNKRNKWINLTYKDAVLRTPHSGKVSNEPVRACELKGNERKNSDTLPSLQSFWA